MCLWYWTAASETHQRKSNIFIIQQNKRNVKDRSFSRKIESNRLCLVNGENSTINDEGASYEKKC